MKKILLAILLCAGAAVQAQQKTKSENPIQGFWVIESNMKSPKDQVVKFYNANQQLLYQEAYNRKIINYNRKRNRNMLDSALITVLNYKQETGTATLANLVRYHH